MHTLIPFPDKNYKDNNNIIIIKKQIQLLRINKK